jgi:hypothetical protein
METTAPTFRFTLYRFVGPQGERKTEVVRDLAVADGMRGLIDQNKKTIRTCMERVETWASSKGLSVSAHEPFPSSKHPGKVWIEFRFGGVML